jgi:hypothetical protein
VLASTRAARTPVPEHDSAGEFVFLVDDVFRIPAIAHC